MFHLISSTRYNINYLTTGIRIECEYLLHSIEVHSEITMLQRFDMRVIQLERRGLQNINNTLAALQEKGKYL
jgi:hypothetical protein